jgi:hypothetical protein
MNFSTSELKEICQLIGCSGVDLDMCRNHPENCEIVRKVVDFTEAEFERGLKGTSERIPRGILGQ